MKGQMLRSKINEIWPDLAFSYYEIIVLFISNLFTKFNRYWPFLAKVMDEKIFFFRDWSLTFDLII